MDISCSGYQSKRWDVKRCGRTACYDILRGTRHKAFRACRLEPEQPDRTVTGLSFRPVSPLAEVSPCRY